MNYILMAFGQLFEVIGFFLSLPTCICNSLAQYFYTAGTIDVEPENNDEENEEE